MKAKVKKVRKKSQKQSESMTRKRRKSSIENVVTNIMDNVDNMHNLELSFTQYEPRKDDNTNIPDKEVTRSSSNDKESRTGRRGSAYFRGDGGRREYAPEESYIFDMILDDKLQEAYALEKKEQEEMEQERLTFALEAFRLKYKTNADKSNNDKGDVSKESAQRPKFMLEACSEEDKQITELSYDV